MDPQYEKLQEHGGDGLEEDLWADMGDDLLFGPDDLVYRRDADAEVHSGGFSVQSILLKNKIPPIITYNVRQQGQKQETQDGGGGQGPQVSDLFADLVVPNWAYQAGGQRKRQLDTPNVVRNRKFQDEGSESEPEEREPKEREPEEREPEEREPKGQEQEGPKDVLDEKLHQKLLDLVKAETAKRTPPAKHSRKRHISNRTTATRKKARKTNVRVV